MRIEVNDERERLYSTLLDVSPHGHKSTSLDAAARYYIQMKRENGILDDLMSQAVERGSLTPGEIAEIVDTHQVPVEYESDYTIGERDV